MTLLDKLQADEEKRHHEAGGRCGYCQDEWPCMAGIRRIPKSKRTLAQAVAIARGAKSAPEYGRFYA